MGSSCRDHGSNERGIPPNGKKGKCDAKLQLSGSGGAEDEFEDVERSEVDEGNGDDAEGDAETSDESAME